MTPKLVQDIMGYKWKNISAGGVTLFATTCDNKEGDFMVAWGQGANYSELGLGAGAVRFLILYFHYYFASYWGAERILILG